MPPCITARWPCRRWAGRPRSTGSEPSRSRPRGLARGPPASTGRARRHPGRGHHRRRTDRRTYGSWPVPVGDIALMGARAARAGVMLRQIGCCRSSTRSWPSRSPRHNTDTDYLTELNAWSGRHGSVAGYPPETPRRSTLAPPSPRGLRGPALKQPSLASPVEDNGVMLAPGHRDRRRPAGSGPGRPPVCVLLSATAMGLAYLPCDRNRSRSRDP